jgi:predicted MFS family arabinose efflux permease
VEEGIGRRLADTAGALGTTVRNGELLRVQLAFGAYVAFDFALTVALGVLAFEEGGAGLVAAVGVLRLVPSALLAPLAAGLTDRLRRERVLIGAGLAGAAATGGAAAVLAADGPFAAALALAVLATVVTTPFRAAHTALLPSLCTTTPELTSSNVVRGLLEAAAVAAGPLLAALLLDLGDAAAAVGAAAALSAVSAVLVLRLRYEAPPREAPAGRPRPVAEAVEGLRALAADRAVALLVGLGAVQCAIRGALNVLLVVLAIDELGLGESGVGVLTSALGVGGLVGAIASGLLIGSHRMAAWFGAAVALWGLPLVLMGALPVEGVALLMLGVVGVANALLDVAVFTVLARLVPDAVLGRVLAGGEAVWTLGIGLGALVAAPLEAALGLQGALVAIGLMAPAAVAASWAALARLDRRLEVRDRELAVLRQVPMLRPLPVAALEQLARELEQVVLTPGRVLFRAGDEADAFFVVAEGDVEAVDPAGGAARVLRAGEGFGELALLRDVTRTRSVRASTDARLLVLHRAPFLRAVGGFSSASAAADATVARYLDAG